MMMTLWTEAQLATMIGLSDASDDAAALQMDRSPDAVADLRRRIHIFHTVGLGRSVLPARLRAYLAARRGRARCYCCGAGF